MIGNSGVYLRMKSAPDERGVLALLDLRLHALDLVGECRKQPGFRLWTSPGVDFLPTSAILRRCRIICHSSLLQQLLLRSCNIAKRSRRSTIQCTMYGKS